MRGDIDVSVTITVNHALKKFGEATIIPDLNVKIKEGEIGRAHV